MNQLRVKIKGKGRGRPKVVLIEFPADLSEITFLDYMRIRDTAKEGIRPGKVVQRILEIGKFYQIPHDDLIRGTNTMALMMQPEFSLFWMIRNDNKLTVESKIETIPFETILFGRAIEFDTYTGHETLTGYCMAFRSVVEGYDKAEAHDIERMPASDVLHAIHKAAKSFKDTKEYGERPDLFKKDPFSVDNPPTPEEIELQQKYRWNIHIKQLANSSDMCKGMNEEQILQIPFGKILDDLLYIKRFQNAQYAAEKARIERIKVESK